MNSPLAYIGGKSKLAETIIDLMPGHEAYCEVFAGAAWVLFRKEPSKVETINDLDSDLVSFYRVVKHHPEEFLRQFKWMLSSREVFEDLKSQAVATGWTDVQRAARYFYLQRHAFGGRPRNPAYGFNPLNRPRLNLFRIEEQISEVHLRLSGVNIEHKDWRDFVSLCDRPQTFFYIDPPYWGRKDYRHNLQPQDFRDLASLLVGIKGKFLLSLDDRPEVREIFAPFDIKSVEVIYSAGCRKDKKRMVGKEVLIKNY